MSKLVTLPNGDVINPEIVDAIVIQKQEVHGTLGIPAAVVVYTKGPRICITCSNDAQANDMRERVREIIGIGAKDHASKSKT